MLRGVQGSRKQFATPLLAVTCTPQDEPIEVCWCSRNWRFIHFGVHCPVVATPLHNDASNHSGALPGICRDVPG